MSAYAVSARGLVSRRIPQGVLAPMNALLFGAGQQGAFYDPSDLSTLFQDSAGTTPVTAMEQPVGRMLDLSGNGNHAIQATTTKRSVVSRRVNLLLDSEYASGLPAGGSTPGSIVGYAAAAHIDLDGTNVTAYRTSSNTPINALYTISATVKMDSGAAPAWVGAWNSATTDFNLLVNGFVPTIGYTLSLLDSGIYRVKTSFLLPSAGSAGSCGPVKVATNSANGFTVSGIDLRFASSDHLPYQWVNTATDYDDNAFKFPTYLKSDGIDDSYSSATGGGGNAGFFFSQAITVLGGAGTARTLFSDAGTNTGYIVRLNASNQLELAAGNGTAYTTIATAGTLAVGTTDVVQAWDDGTNLNVKIGNGPTASIARPAVAAGTAGYTMGQDNGASTGYFNGRMYSTVYRKDSAPTQVQREAVAVLQRLKARMP